MSRKTLLLNSNYQVLNFLPERKAIKLLFKDKVEIISSWDKLDIKWENGKIKYPAILRLKSHVKRNFSATSFSRRAIVKRDNSTCQFCGIKLSAAQVTIDHIIPKSRGGNSSFTNCVVSCQSCNNIKADRTPEEANMILLRKPTHPSFCPTYYLSDSQDLWHESWDPFLINS